MKKRQAKLLKNQANWRQNKSSHRLINIIWRQKNWKWSWTDFKIEFQIFDQLAPKSIIEIYGHEMDLRWLLKNRISLLAHRGNAGKSFDFQIDVPKLWSISDIFRHPIFSSTYWKRFAESLKNSTKDRAETPTRNKMDIVKSDDAIKGSLLSSKLLPSACNQQLTANYSDCKLFSKLLPVAWFQQLATSNWQPVRIATK